MKHRPGLRIALAILLGCALLASAVILSVSGYREVFNAGLRRFLESIETLGAWGPVAVGAAFVPACLLFLPGSPLTLFGGFAFGKTFTGLAAVAASVSIGSTLGAAAAFLTGRTVARHWIEHKVAGNIRFQAIDAAVGEHGFKIVLLTRLSPVFPFNLINYAFGLTGVRFRDYVLASWIGMFPGTLMYVYLGSTVGQLSDVIAGRVRQTALQQAFFYVGLVATVAVTVIITRIARRSLNAAIAAQDVAGDKGGTPPESTGAVGG